MQKKIDMWRQECIAEGMRLAKKSTADPDLFYKAIQFVRKVHLANEAEN